jgi:DNA repair protein RecN (Recombination protein N)
MLQTLRIKNLALVENLTVDFEPGLNMITGETGAGKSVLIGALGLLLGGRADKTLIRTGEDQCGAEALFTLERPAGINAILQENGLDACEAGQLVIRRIINAAGTSRNFINGGPTTLQVLKSIGDQLVDMHGPHDHQSLLSTDFQLELLDAFGECGPTAELYGAVYAEWTALRAQRHALEGDEGQIQREIDLLRFQCQEIETANLVEGEEAELESEHRRVANAQKIIELSDGIRRALTDDETAAAVSLAAAYKLLHELAPVLDVAVEWQARAQSLSIEIRDLAESVATTAQSIEADPERLQWLEDRMALYRKLKRKYRPILAEITALLAESKQRLIDLEQRDSKRAELDAQIAQTRTRLEKTGLKLRAAREKAAAELGKAITRQLRDLGFPNGALEVTLTPTDPAPSGMDAVEFAFAPNIGESIRPLRAIASSGEISRVMLAAKAVLAGQDRIPLLVFDEIDANIGGEMGRAVGAKLKAVAKHHQVICITHLPQVAVFGPTHFAVCKEVTGGRTRTLIERLEGAARVEEVARMLGGKDSTDFALRHARELLKTPDTK